LRSKEERVGDVKEKDSGERALNTNQRQAEKGRNNTLPFLFVIMKIQESLPDNLTGI
jgi:hypothetical protein